MLSNADEKRRYDEKRSAHKMAAQFRQNHRHAATNIFTYTFHRQNQTNPKMRTDNSWAEQRAMNKGEKQNEIQYNFVNFKFHFVSFIF